MFNGSDNHSDSFFTERFAFTFCEIVLGTFMIDIVSFNL